jgi:type I restriction-modification system DNA methylase subunit
MTNYDTTSTVKQALAGFATEPLSVAASALFASLGYASERRLKFPSLSACFAEFDRECKAAKYFPEAGSIKQNGGVLIQQLTSVEIASNPTAQLAMFEAPGPDFRQFESYLFFTVPLPSAAYTRTELAERARALNALFKQPVLVLFRYGSLISLAITYRRTSKKDQSRDVIERKVTLMKDIDVTKPHPGHLAILEDFSLPALSRARQRDIRNFSDLDEAWRESLSAQLLNRQFYDEIANWYFWARELWKTGEVKLPADIKTEADASLFLIRLLTRLIFCWFLREKTNPQTGAGLIPDELYDPHRLPDLLKDVSPDSGTYYTAILQNLFFASLNTEMDTPGRPPVRRFLNEGDGRRSDDHMVHQLWRHPGQLKDRAAFETTFRRIPFLNGGLFECLDDRVPKANTAFTTEIRLDGFSSDPKKQPKIPNRLFFGQKFDETFTVDLSNAFGDQSGARVTVRPLLDIFRRFKFTLTENTPIEEEVALDPELLGHVFENLLAAYNPETGTVARKTTGSFYTPRVVVDWMVDEALVVYLHQRVPDIGPETLRDLLSWNPLELKLTDPQRNALIDAIDALKALDPACGSGAFPMGLLQKLVHLLKQLDPDNQGWKRRQETAARALTSSLVREAALAAIQIAFARDNDDYGRKLYLIENCLYGVDIQPIAVQIAKLRFFIALIVDQKIMPAEKNYGILALPNLETKIVAANTLLGLKRGQLQLGSEKVRLLERELQQVRHDYFTARSYADKKRLRKQDQELCEQLSDSLVFAGELSAADSKRVTGWNPYSATEAAPFFDAGWMFGLPAQPDDGVFDLVIGNPPYVRQEELKNVTVQDSNSQAAPLKDVLKSQYECYTGTADLYVYFFERSFQLLRTGGVLSFITSNKYFRAAYGERLRTYLLYATHPCVILDFGDSPVFTAVAYPCIIVTQKTRHLNRKGDLPDPDAFKLPERIIQLLPEPDRTFRVMTWVPGPSIREFPLIFDENSFAFPQRGLKSTGWQLESKATTNLLERISSAGKPLGEYVNNRWYWGIKTGLNDAFVVDRTIRDNLVAADKSSADVLKPFLRGRDIKRWRLDYSDYYLIRIESSENKTHPWSGKTKSDAEQVFAKCFPAIYSYFSPFRKVLIERSDQGKYFWELRSCAYWDEFEKRKIIVPAISGSVNVCLDTEKFLCNNKTSIFVCNDAAYVASIVNSPVAFWFATQVFATKQGGFYDFEPRYSCQWPIPFAAPEQKASCTRLAEALTWLNIHRLKDESTGDVPISLMAAFFEQWLNGLVYELFFAHELHSRNIRLFEETAKLDNILPGIPKLDVAAILKSLQALFERAYDTKHPIRSMLFSLRSLETVRVIEETFRKPFD